MDTDTTWTKEIRRVRLLAVLLPVLVLALLLTGCSKGGAQSGDTFTLGDATLHYTGYEITEDETGNDAIVITYEYTNNGEENNSLLWAVVEAPYQGDTALDTAMVWVDESALEAVSDSAFQEVAPGDTLEVKTTYILQDTRTPVTVKLESMNGDGTAEFTIELE